jgi:hypothetical protein
MYIICIPDNKDGVSYINKLKKVVDSLTEDAIFVTYSEAINKSRSFTKAQVIGLKEFILTDEGSKLFKEFCLHGLGK